MADVCSVTDVRFSSWIWIEPANRMLCSNFGCNFCSLQMAYLFLHVGIGILGLGYEKLFHIAHFSFNIFQYKSLRCKYVAEGDDGSLGRLPSLITSDCLHCNIRSLDASKSPKTLQLHPYIFTRCPSQHETQKYLQCPHRCARQLFSCLISTVCWLYISYLWESRGVWW